MASKFPRWSLGGLFKLRPFPKADAQPQDKSASQSGKYKVAGAPAAPASPFHAVSILTGLESCAAARRFTGHRFLSREAPRLPLPSCDIAHCKCRFKHHKDRRVGPRRRSEVGMVHGIWQGDEKRRTGGRRADDR